MSSGLSNYKTVHDRGTQVLDLEDLVPGDHYRVVTTGSLGEWLSFIQIVAEYHAGQWRGRLLFRRADGTIGGKPETSCYAEDLGIIPYSGGQWNATNWLQARRPLHPQGPPPQVCCPHVCRCDRRPCDGK